MHFSTMEARLKETWKPLLNMILCIQRLAGMFGASDISAFCMMKIFKKTVVIVHEILIIESFRNCLCNKRGKGA